MYNSDYFQNVNESSINGNNNSVSQDMDINVNMNMNQMGSYQNATRERVIHRTFIHEVPHTCPVHTKIVNHHVYKHTYRPVYTCSEENVCSNVQCGSCCQFQ